MMGSIIYSHLNDSLLLDKSLIAANFHGVSETELQNALQKYRDYCILNFDQLVSEVSPTEKSLRLFVGNQGDDRLLKQGAFYLNSVIITDPLFELSKPIHERKSSYYKAFGLPETKRINRKDIADAAKKLISYRQLVAQGYVKIFPTSLDNESPAKIPIYSSSDGFESVLPEHVLKIYKDAADVKSTISSPHGLLVLKTLKTGRMISVDFDGRESGRSFGFNLMQNEVVSYDQETGFVKFSSYLPEEPPSENLFKSWVSQSINRAAWMHFKMLDHDISWSARFGAQYLTRSGFASSLLNSTGWISTNDIESTTSCGLLNLNLPIFENASMSKLMAARSDEVAFQRFRLEMEKYFREIRLENDQEVRNKKIENAMHELTEIQLTEVDSTIRRLRRKGILTGVGAVASLGAAAVTSGTTLLATMLAAYEGYKTFEDYRLATKENPAYFLWRVVGRK